MAHGGATSSFAAPSTISVRMKRLGSSNGVPTKKETPSARLHAGCSAVSPGGGSIVSSQHRAGAEGEGLPLDGELREYLKATYLKPLRDAEREMRAGRRSRLSRILGAMPTMGPQSKPARQVPTLRSMTPCSCGCRGPRQTSLWAEVAKSVNTDFLDKLSFEGDRLVATLDLGAGGSFDQILERFELYLNAKVGTSASSAGLAITTCCSWRQSCCYSSPIPIRCHFC